MKSREIILVVFLSFVLTGCITYPTQIHYFNQHGYNLRISKDGKYAIATRPQNRYSAVYALESKKVLYSKKMDDNYFTFMPNNNFVDNSIEFRIYDVLTGETISELSDSQMNGRSKDFFLQGEGVLLGDVVAKDINYDRRTYYGLTYFDGRKILILRDEILDIPQAYKHAKGIRIDDFDISKIILSDDQKYFYTIDTIPLPDEAFDAFNIEHKNEYGLVKWRVSDFKPVKNFKKLIAPKKATFDISADGKKILISSSVYPYLCLLDTATFNPIFEAINMERCMQIPIIEVNKKNYYQEYENVLKDHAKRIIENIEKGEFIDQKYTKRYGGFLSKGKCFFVVGEKAKKSVYNDPIQYEADNYIYVYTADQEMKLMTKMPFDVSTLCEEKRRYKVVASSQYNNKICLMIKTGTQSGYMLVLEYDEKENKLKEYWKAPLPKKLDKLSVRTAVQF